MRDRNVGAGACEIRVRGDAGAFRVICGAKFADAVYVLHAVQKKAQKTAQAAKRLCIAQPRVSEIVRGKVDLMSLDYLVGLCAKGGVNVEVRLAA